MGKMIDLTGQRFGKLLVLRQSEHHLGGKPAWVCRCDCGAEKPVRSSSLRMGKSTACRKCAVKRHGHTSHGQMPTSEYRTWLGMVQRCTNPKATHFDCYGGRGITVCDRWRTFDNFLADMGNRPIGCTLDRQDNNGNYEPCNCRWATRKEQASNRRITQAVLHSHLHRKRSKNGTFV